MTTLAEVRLWGRTIGAVSLEDGADVAAFQYTPDFAASGIEISPIVMPLGNRVHRFPQLARNTFLWPAGPAGGFAARQVRQCPDRRLAGDPGLHPRRLQCRRAAVLHRRARHGRARICPRRRAHGATCRDNRNRRAGATGVQRAEPAQPIPEASFADASRAESLQAILRVGTSAGGARAKAVIAWNRDTDEVRSDKSRPAKASTTGCSNSTASPATGTRSSTTPRATALSNTPTT